MINLDAVKITPRDEEVLRLLAQGCSNKEIAGGLNISPRTVKQHLRALFLRAGITEGRKRVKLATAVFGSRWNHAAGGSANDERNSGYDSGLGRAHEPGNREIVGNHRASYQELPAHRI